MACTTSAFRRVSPGTSCCCRLAISPRADPVWMLVHGRSGVHRAYIRHRRPGGVSAARRCQPMGLARECNSVPCISAPGRTGTFTWMPMSDDPQGASTRSVERRGGSERSEWACVAAQTWKNSDMTSITSSIAAVSMSRWVTMRFGFRIVMSTRCRSQCAAKASSRSVASFAKTMLV